MKRLFSFLAVSIIASHFLMLSSSAEAATSVALFICKKTSSGAVKIRSARCKSGEVKVNNIFQIDHTIGFASVNGTDGAVISSGGNGTTSVSSVRNGAGDYRVTFTGNYPTTISATQLSVLSTARADNFQVTNAAVESATSTSIVVRIFSWKSDVTSEIDTNVFVQVLLGS